MIFAGPTGNLIKGHVLDCNLEHMQQALKDLDDLLYIKWNPKKLKGWGCWEIRRRPNEKRPVAVYDLDGNTLVRAEYVENPLVNHILDCAFLNYDVIRKLKTMDTWNKDHWIHDPDYHIAKAQEKAEDKAVDAMNYAIKQNKRAIRDFMELLS